jgi:hypothetical protein
MPGPPSLFGAPCLASLAVAFVLALSLGACGRTGDERTVEPSSADRHEPNSLRVEEKDQNVRRTGANAVSTGRANRSSLRRQARRPSRRQHPPQAHRKASAGESAGRTIAEQMSEPDAGTARQPSGPDRVAANAAQPDESAENPPTQSQAETAAEEVAR